MKKIILPSQSHFFMSKGYKIFFYILSIFLIILGFFMIEGGSNNNDERILIFFGLCIILQSLYFLWQTTITVFLSNISIQRISLFGKKEILFNDIIGFEHKYNRGIYVIKIKSKEKSIFIHGYIANKETLNNWIETNFTNLGEMFR